MFTGKHHDSPSDVPNTGQTIRDLECTVARVDGILADAATLNDVGIILQFPPLNTRIDHAVDRINQLDVLRMTAAFAMLALKKQAHVQSLLKNPVVAADLMAEAQKLEAVVDYFAAEIKAVRL
jgi:hypothetical protein